MIDALAGVGAALALFLLLVLAAKRPFRPADIWLGVWLASQAVLCAGPIVSTRSPAALALPVLILGQAAGLLLGPSQYLYAATALGARRRWAVHAAALSLAGAAMLVLGWFGGVRAEAGAMQADIGTPWLLLLPLSVIVGFALYPGGVLRLAASRRERLKDALSEFGAADPGWLRAWAWSSLAVTASWALVFVNSALAAWPVGAHMVVTLSVLVAHIAYVGQRGLTRAGVFFAAPEPEAAAPGKAPPPDRSQAAADYARVQSMLAVEKPHLKPDLTAQELADRLGWAPERLTAALRHGAGSSFFDAVNAARVQEVQALARDPANARISLLGLAHEAGFGSKSAFYDAFGRHAGCTPAAWRRQLSP